MEKKEIIKRVAENIRIERVRKKLSQDKLAEKAGFTLFASKQLYKNISIFNKKISTFYLADKIGPFWV